MEMSGGLSSRMTGRGQGCRGARGMDRLVLMSGSSTVGIVYLFHITHAICKEI